MTTTHTHTIASRTAREVGGWQEPTPVQLESFAVDYLRHSRRPLHWQAIKRLMHQLRELWRKATGNQLWRGEVVVWVAKCWDNPRIARLKTVTVIRQVGDWVYVRVRRHGDGEYVRRLHRSVLHVRGE